MSRRRNRGFLDSMEFLSSLTVPPRTAHVAFVTMANAFKQIDRAMLDEMQADIIRCVQPADESHPEPWSSSRFSDDQAHKDKGVEDIKRNASHTLSETETLAYLADTSCLTAWRRVFQVLLGYQGHSNNHYQVSWMQAKSSARVILDFAQAVLDTYEDDVCQSLIRAGHDDVGAGVDLKLKAILSFCEIYSRPTYDQDKTNHLVPQHQFQASFSIFVAMRKQSRERGLSRKKSISSTHQNLFIKRNSMLMITTLSAVVTGAILLGLAFQHSSNKSPGSSTDADFWLLMQSSVMQGLGLVTTITTSLVPRVGKQNIFEWTMLSTGTIAIIGLGSALSAPFTYVRAPPIYSSVISFVASMMQALMVLQLVLFIDMGIVGIKMD